MNYIYIYIWVCVCVWPAVVVATWPGLAFVSLQEKKRRETESLVADRDGQLRHLRERLGSEEKDALRTRTNWTHKP